MKSATPSSLDTRTNVELVRRGGTVRDALIGAIESGKLSQGQQTWAIWTLGRSAPEDRSIDEFVGMLTGLPKGPTQTRRLPLNLRIQALRILAHRIRNHTDGRVPQVVVAALTDPEPRIRFEAVQAIWQAKQSQHLPALLNQLAQEEDRLVFYSGWRALRELSDIAFRKKLLADERPRVRLATLLSLFERHEITLDEVLEIAEHDSDSRIQNWAMTWAMNPRPPKNMPNTTARVELEDSVSVGDLVTRASEAKNAKLRRMYLAMVSRATYRDHDDWERIRDFYLELETDDERALVIVPLARDNDATPFLWKALEGNEALRQATIKGLVSLSRRSQNSPEKIAQFLLEQMAKNPRDPSVSGAIEAMSRLGISAGCKPSNIWDARLSQVFEGTSDVAIRAKILTVLLAVDPLQAAKGNLIKGVLETASREPDPRLYSFLLILNARLGIEVDMRPPEKASLDGVLAQLPHADTARARELFFSTASSTACAACHRISGRGKSFAPDLSGIGLRSEPKTIIQSILDPSATITEGFQLQTVVTRDGVVLSGAVLGETDSQIRLIRTDGKLEVIDVGLIESRGRTKLSAMPTGFELLGDDRVADIVALLVTCRHDSGRIRQ